MIRGLLVERDRRRQGEREEDEGGAGRGEGEKLRELEGFECVILHGVEVWVTCDCIHSLGIRDTVFEKGCLYSNVITRIRQRGTHQHSARRPPPPSGAVASFQQE
jgi:hypothetical protein